MIRTAETLYKKIMERWEGEAKNTEALQWMSLAHRIKHLKTLSQGDLLMVISFLKENDGHPKWIASFEAMLAEEVMVCRKKM